MASRPPLPDDDPIDLPCPNCGYNVAIIPHDRCPECGQRFDRRELRRSHARAEQMHLWQPLTLILTIPIGVALLILLSSVEAGWLIMLILPVGGAFVMIACALASLAAAPTLAGMLQQRGIGIAHSRKRVTAAIAVLAILLQMLILASGIALAHALTGPWRSPF